jgi:methionyl aminopeptidase
VIIIKSPDEIARMRNAGKVVAVVLKEIEIIVKQGITTGYLDKLASEVIKKNKAKSAFLGYRGYPATICTSVNEEVVHGIPGDRKLSNGDLLSVDVGVVIDGYYGDAAVTLPVGDLSFQSEKLLKTGKLALDKAIEKCYSGNRLYDISEEIQNTAERQGYSVVRDYVGHGIGQNMHEDPQVPNFAMPSRGPILKNGMVLAPEPMVNEGTFEVKVLRDGWTVVTADGKRSCHFEHTVAITENGPEILTKLD